MFPQVLYKHYRSKSITQILVQIQTKKNVIQTSFFQPNFEQMPGSPGSIILKSLNYRQYSAKENLLKFRNVKETSSVMTSTVDLFGEVEIHLRTKTKTAILMLFFTLVFQFV